MSTLSTGNFTTNTVEAHFSPDAIEAQRCWIATGRVSREYVVSVQGRSFTTIDSPFGISVPSPEKMEALLAGIQSGRTGKTVDRGSFACFADDDADEG